MQPVIRNNVQRSRSPSYDAGRCFYTGRCAGTWLFIIFLFVSVTGSAQRDSTAIDVSRIRFDSSIAKVCWLATQPKGHLLPDTAILSLPFVPGKVSRFYPHYPPPASYLEKDLYLRFTLHNGGDTTKRVFFLPGFYCRDITLFKTSPGNLLDSFRKVEHSCREFAGARLIRLLPHETAVFYCRFNFVRTNVNIFTPYLIETDYINQWLTRKRDLDQMLDIVTYIVSGIMLLMIFYSLAVYLQNRNKEFIYYAIYTLCTALLLFLKSYMSVYGHAGAGARWHRAWPW